MIYYLRDPILHDSGNINAYLNRSVHVLLDIRKILTGSFSDTLPEVLRNSIPIEMLLKVNRYALKEAFFSDVVRKHAEC